MGIAHYKNAATPLRNRYLPALLNEVYNFALAQGAQKLLAINS